MRSITGNGDSRISLEEELEIEHRRHELSHKEERERQERLAKEREAERQQRQRVQRLQDIERRADRGRDKKRQVDRTIEQVDSDILNLQQQCTRMLEDTGTTAIAIARQRATSENDPAQQTVRVLDEKIENMRYRISQYRMQLDRSRDEADSIDRHYMRSLEDEENDIEMQARKAEQ